MRATPTMPRLASVALLSLLPLVGCTSGSEVEAEPTPSVSSGPEEIAYYRCLESNGVILQTPMPGQLRVDKDRNSDAAVTDAAEKACEAELAAIPKTGVSDQELAAERAISACVREKGFKDFPDPDPQTGEVDLDAAGMTDDPDLRVALRDCSPAAKGDREPVVGG